MNPYKAIAAAATAVFVLFSIIGDGPSTYRFAFLFLTPALWAVYGFRERLALLPGHFGILAAAFVIHNLGAFGAYREKYFGLEFDAYVHFAFGLAGGMIVARALRQRLGFSNWQNWAATIIVILGLSGIHELVEFVSTLILGSEKGMLKINDPDKFDTHKDLANNTFGALLGLACYWAAARRARKP